WPPVRSAMRSRLVTSSIPTTTLAISVTTLWARALPLAASSLAASEPGTAGGVMRLAGVERGRADSIKIRAAGTPGNAARAAARRFEVQRWERGRPGRKGIRGPGGGICKLEVKAAGTAALPGLCHGLAERPVAARGARHHALEEGVHSVPVAQRDGDRL